MAVPTAPVAAGSLVGGFLVASKVDRKVGAGVLVAAAALLTRTWRAQVGTPAALGLLATYLGAFGGSHPLAKRVGVWPSVLGVSALSGLASWLVADRRA